MCGTQHTSTDIERLNLKPLGHICTLRDVMFATHFQKNKDYKTVCFHEQFKPTNPTTDSYPHSKVRECFAPFIRAIGWDASACTAHTDTALPTASIRSPHRRVPCAHRCAQLLYLITTLTELFLEPRDFRDSI